jgi:chromosomal replication initiator protein
VLTHVRLTHPTLNRTWFETLVPRQLQNGVIHVTCDTLAQLNFLTGQCQQSFNAAAQAVTNRLSVVMFHCPKLKAVGVMDGQEVGPMGGPASMPLSPDYSFEQYVTGPSNNFAHAAGVAVADHPGKVYNPLFIHGGVGLGKTHLLQAICQRLLERSPNLRILYLSCDEFINQFMNCVESGDMNSFRFRYRSADVLVIDDIHFFGGRERIQEEFFHTFNTLHQHNRQVIISADAPPSEVPELEERLVSRFNWGLVTPIERPDYDTRVAILRKKARNRDLELPDNIVNYVAGRVDSNTRELEGAIQKLQGMAKAIQLAGGPDAPPVPIDMALARRALGDLGQPVEAKRTSIEDIVNAVVRYYGVKVSDLHSKRRNRSIAFPRQVCMYIARHATRYSLEEIGGYFGGRDHTTVLHGVRTVQNQLETDPDVARQVRTIRQQLDLSPDPKTDDNNLV